MWGQVIIYITILLDMRIIPTRVGTSSICCPSVVSKKDHPHACGDKFDVHVRPEGAKGSSPRVWGQGCYADLNNEWDRIIPTRVGTRMEEQHKGNVR